MSHAGADFARDYFSLFRIPARYGIDERALDGAYHDLQARVHPDRFAHLSDAERRVSLQWATQVNEAYRTLRDPLLRARYLLHLKGVDVGMESNTAMPAEFLMQQMEWREAVSEASAAGDADELEVLRARVGRDLADARDTLAGQFDAAADYVAAAATVRRLMFLERLTEEIDDALEAVYDNN